MPAGADVRWGWHRLADDQARRLVVTAGVIPGDLVLDVGAGDGAITAPLVSAGAKVVAVELHPRRVALLRARFTDEPVTVVQADAADLRLPRRPFKVVANPPFALTTALLRRLLSPGSRLLSAHLVVPVPVARRWAAGRAPGAGRWRQEFDLRVGPHLPPRAFQPPIKAPVAVLTVRRRP